MTGKKNILFYTEAWGVGGIESFVMNTVETLDLKHFQFEIFSTHDWSDVYDAKIFTLGGKRYVVFHNTKPDLVTRLRSSIQEWNRLLLSKQFDVVHINTMNGVGFVYAHIAKECGVPIRVVHSHNSAFGAGDRGAKQIAHSTGKLLYGHCATHRLACSEEAGRYLFGRSSFTVLHNGIDTQRFIYNPERRLQVRKDLNVPADVLLLGAVGRLEPAKNPLFQVDVLAGLHSQGVNAYLALWGDGSLRENIIRYAEEQHVSAYLRLPGLTTHAEDCLSALDVFTMPSLYEGFPMAAIEAAANGVLMILSKEVPQICGDKLNTREYHLKTTNADEWCEVIIKTKKIMLNNRQDYSKKNTILKFDRKTTTRTLEKIYIK